MPARWLTNGVTTPGRHDSGPRAILTGISRVWAEKLDVPVADDCSSGKFALALSRVTEIGEQVVAAVAASLARGGPVVRGQLIASRFYEAIQRELRQLPIHDPNRAALIAASDRCQRIGAANNPGALLDELRKAIAVLEANEHAPVPPTRLKVRPILRLIEGGLSKT